MRRFFHPPAPHFALPPLVFRLPRDRAFDELLHGVAESFINLERWSTTLGFR